MFSKKLILLINLINIIVFAEFADILVQLPCGTLRGREAKTTTNRTYYTFIKIPYAAPPIGNLRFKPPIPPKKWSGILNTTEVSEVMCYQVSWNTEMESEDCLYLNVYTPKLPCKTDKESYPVMFFMHAGGFVFGNSDFHYYGPEFLIDQNVIVVTINYRLGPFGFLSTQDTVIPGNAGLKDQHLAIKWTHENINLFGGDPNKITIFGQSAGSASVTYQLLNKKSEGLFRAGICESGTFLSPWAFQRNSRKIAFKTAGYINSTFNNNNNSEILYKFLMKVSAKELDLASEQVDKEENVSYYQLVQGYFYAPVIEAPHKDAFITEKMYVQLKAGDILKIPILIGFTSEEAIGWASDLEYLRNVTVQYDENLDWVVPNDMRIEDKNQRVKVGKRIRKIYAADDTFTESLSSFIRFMSDTEFTRSVTKFAQFYSKLSDTYFYQFSYDGIIGNVSAKIDGAERVGHGEDTNYIFRTRYEGYDNSNLNDFPESDRITVKRLLKLWTNFARTLNPTPKPSSLLQNVIWPKMTQGRFAYLDIGEDLEIKYFPKKRSFEEWVKIYDSLGYDDFDTY